MEGRGHISCATVALYSGMSLCVIDLAYTADDFACEFASIIRGHHVYNSVWTPAIGETLPLGADDGSEHDAYAVGIFKDSAVVGHAPREVSRIFYYFLQHGGSISAEITGHRKFGHRLEVPCCYKLTGKPKYVKHAKKPLLKITHKK